MKSLSEDLLEFSTNADEHIKQHQLDHNQRYLPYILGVLGLYHIGLIFAYLSDLFNMQSILPESFFYVQLLVSITILIVSQVVYRVSLSVVKYLTWISLAIIYVSLFLNVLMLDFSFFSIFFLLGVITLINLSIYARYSNIIITLGVIGAFMTYATQSFQSIFLAFEINIIIILWTIVSLFVNNIVIRNYTQSLYRDHHFRKKSDDLEKQQQDLEHRHMDVQRSRHFLSNILRQLSTSVAIFDERGRVIDSNESMRQYFSNLFDAKSNDADSIAIRENMKRLTKSDPRYDFELKHNKRSYEMKLSIIQAERQSGNSILVEAIDITDLKKQQDELNKVLRVRDILIRLNNLVTKEVDIKVYFDYILEQLVNIFDKGELACVLLMDENHILRPEFTYGYDESDIPNFAIEFESSFLFKQIGHVPQRTVILTDIQNDLGEGCPPLLASTGTFEIKSSLSTPIIVNDKLYGILNIDSSYAEGFTDEDITIMEYFRENLAMVFSNQALIHHTLHLSKCDALTGLNNRWVLENIKEQEYIRWSTNDVSVSFVVMDLNSLKQINDAYGHEAGDEYIVILAEALKTTFRKTDILLRTGGDEFLCILPSCDLEKATEKTMIANRRFIEECHGMFGDYDFGFSFGISNSLADTKNFDELLKLADTRMYVAKNNYRSRQ